MPSPSASPVPAVLDSAELARLGQAVEGYSTAQLQWASGYLAGLAAAGGSATAAAPPVADAEGGPLLTVLFGSQTGNGRGLAQRIEAAARELGLAPQVHNLADYRPSRLRKESHVLLVVSTHGEGDPPDDAEALYEFIHSRKAPRLDGLSFAVLALGDSSYEHFCKTGRDFDERLAQLGAGRLHARVDCDVDYEDPAAAWIDAVLGEAAQRLGAARPAAPRLRAVDTAVRYDKANPFAAELLASQPITAPGSTKDVRHIELSLAGSGLAYRPGDSLGIYPRNPEPLVEQLAGALGLDLDSPVPTARGERPLAAALREDLEITALSRGFLERYAAHAGADALAALLEPANRAALGAYLARHQVIDVVRTHPAPVTAVEFAGMLRRLTPRLYSIASSPLIDPEEVHLTVAAIRYEAFGLPHWGAASTWLADGAGEGNTVEVFVEPNERFHLPADPATDVIMIGPGTGVAPFRAFLQEREESGASGRNWLFFGNPHFDTDFLYQIEWLGWRRQGLLTRMDVAFSRDQAHKIYVQHRLRERGADLYEWLENGAWLYVCGDASAMAPDVHEALLAVIAEHGGRSREQAEDYVRELKRAGRYRRDVY